MDLSTTYLGLRLPHPLMPGASPLADTLDGVRRLEDAGAAAIVLRSLFEEQIEREQDATLHHLEAHANAHAEAQSYFPNPGEFALGPERYVEHVAAVKRAVAVPVIASLNGTTPGAWVDYAKKIQQAGADALELNVYALGMDVRESGADLERRTLETVRSVKDAVTIPVAVKLSPFYSSLAHFAAQVAASGADGLVLFNRFYQPDLDVEHLEVVPRLELSSRAELLLRIRWLAVLSCHVPGSLAVSGGVHFAHDAVKAVMAGAHAVQVVSSLLREGPERLGALRAELAQWLTEHEYDSLDQMRGSMNLSRSPDPSAFERANYARVLQTWRG